MQSTNTSKTQLGTLAFSVLAVSVAFAFLLSPLAHAAPGTPQVTIYKYVDGVQATALNANSSDFPMSATWNDPTGIGAGTGSYVLGAGNTVPYQAMTAMMQPGADYSTNEVTGGAVVGASCTESKPFALIGYTTGDTLAEAEAATPSLTMPAFVGLTNDKVVIVWNDDCATVPATSTVQVTINKYVDGAQATALSSESSSFPMTAIWNDPTGIGTGVGGYTLDSTSPVPYQTMTVEMQQGAEYTTYEMTNGTTVGADCTEGKPFALVGYTTGTSPAAAEAGTPTTTNPVFLAMTEDQYVIVWNEACGTTGGTIGGDVSGGQGVLAVSSITAQDTTATSDGTYENGWVYIFHITLPTNEPGVALKFSNWTSGSSTMPVAGNMRISSLQADNGGATITVLAASTYTTPNLNMTTDLDALTPGIQVEVKVEVKVPAGTADGSYTTNYGVRSQ